MLGVTWGVAALVALLSIQPVVNIFSPHQIMNTSFDPLDLVNTYGAFGSVGKERYNVVFEGTEAEFPNDSTDWKPYPYKGLPVALDERPPQIAPYQLRLDWQMWFAAMGSPGQYPVDAQSHLEIAPQRSRRGRVCFVPIRSQGNRRVLSGPFSTATHSLGQIRRASGGNEKGWVSGCRRSRPTMWNYKTCCVELIGWVVHVSRVLAMAFCHRQLFLPAWVKRATGARFRHPKSSSRRNAATSTRDACATRIGCEVAPFFNAFSSADPFASCSRYL